MSVYADFNTNFAPDTLAGRTGSCGSDRWADADWLYAIDGLKTAICRDDEQGGRIYIYLTTMAGRQPGDDRGVVPTVIYGATLATTRQRLDQDMRVFRQFVSSIEITPLCLRGRPRAWLQPCSTAQK
jgi:hypothetical protein